MDILEAQRGAIWFVGAGGKKPTIATLAAALECAVVTATVRIPIFDDWVGRVAVTENPVTAVEEATAWPFGVVPEWEREDRYLGYDRATVDELAELDVPVLGRADGARMRRFEAPNEREPPLPTSADTWSDGR